MEELVPGTMYAETRGDQLTEMRNRIQERRELKEQTQNISKDLYTGITDKNEQLNNITFQQKLQEIEEFLGKRIAQQDFLSDNLPLPTIQAIVIEQINSLLYNGTKNHSPIEINTKAGIKILRDNNTDFSIKYLEEKNDKGETSQNIRFNGQLNKEGGNQKNFDLSYNITKNEIEINNKRYPLTEEQGKTMLNAISQMITATKDQYKDQRQNKASR